MIEATIICDSISPQGKRLTTFKLRYPKFIHGEFMTHRVISRNASSSRAVPTKKLLEEVRSDALRAGPVFWGKNQSGMQAAEELSDVTPAAHDPCDRTKSDRQAAIDIWRSSAINAAWAAEHMLIIGVHKQIVNRLLEPFSHINVVATATEWDNFFGLRLHKDAQPEMRALATAMWKVYNLSSEFARPVKLLKPGEWHLPFVDFDHYEIPIDCSKKVSVARCARVSYESFETGKRSTVEEDLKLYDRLLGAQPLHASPAEHQATPDTYIDLGYDSGYSNENEWGNFQGWRQYRKMLPGEAVAPIPEEFR